MTRRLTLNVAGSLLLAIWLALLLAGCGARPTNAPEPEADTRTTSPVATTAGANSSPLSATPTTAPAREALRLVVLHTNDNWGETEPCG